MRSSQNWRLLLGVPRKIDPATNSVAWSSPALVVRARARSVYSSLIEFVKRECLMLGHICRQSLKSKGFGVSSGLMSAQNRQLSLLSCTSQVDCRYRHKLMVKLFKVLQTYNNPGYLCWTMPTTLAWTTNDISHLDLRAWCY